VMPSLSGTKPGGGSILLHLTDMTWIPLPSLKREREKCVIFAWNLLSCPSLSFFLPSLHLCNVGKLK
jgi:hypothetical protein